MSEIWIPYGTIWLASPSMVLHYIEEHLARHVAKTDRQLATRLTNQRRIRAASTFTSRAEAETAVVSAFNQNAGKVSQWISSGAQGRLVINASFSGGRVLLRGATAPVEGTGVRIVLQGDNSGGYYILTGFPTP